MEEQDTYTPPPGWIIVGYRTYPTKSPMRLPYFEDYSENPVHHFTDLRDEGRGLTVFVKGEPTDGYQREWLLFSYLPALEELQAAG
ncbi:MAG: hypothetical protein ACR2OR_15100 [Hyphomicrobiales bacterium]